jgi:predicted dehydrogenase
VTEVFHLPAAQQVPGLVVTRVIDRDGTRAQRVAERFGIPNVGTDIVDLQGEADAVIVATPSRSHAEIAIALLHQGMNVLVEKPLALDVASADAILRAADATGRHVHVGFMHRYFASSRAARETIARSPLGRVTAFRIEWGEVEAWSPVTSYATNRNESGGGVLIDIGSHLLDLVQWWFGGFTVKSCRDDSRGGVEAEAEVAVEVECGDRVIQGHMLLSRLRRLKCATTFTCEHGSLAADIGPGPSETWADAFVHQLSAFCRSTREHSVPEIPGAEAIPVIRAISDAYRMRQLLAYPWESRPPTW